MFTTSVFIRKNTLELRRKLVELGYKILNSGNTTLDAHNYDGKGHHKHIDEGTAIVTSYGGYYGVIYSIDSVLKDRRIDCGTNENLFLAIALLRDDSDYMQWFTDGKDWLFNDFSLHFADDTARYKRYNGKSVFENYHKATIEELIEHFKGK